MPGHAQGLLWGDAAPPGEVLLDDSGELSVDDAVRQFDAGAGRPYRDDEFLPMRASSAVWLRLHLPALPGGTMLTLPHPGLNLAELYVRDVLGSQSGWTVARSGDSLPVAAWAVPHLHPAFFVPAVASSGTEVMLRVQHNHAVSLPWRLWSKPDFDAANQKLLLVLGAYLGFVLLVMCVNVFNWIAWRDRLHLTGAAYVYTIGLTQIALTGVGGQFFWPDSPVWNHYASVVLPLLGATMAGWFTYRVVAGRASAGWRWALIVYCLVGLALLGSFAVFDRDPVFRLVNLYFALCTPVCIFAMVAYALRHPRVGWWFVAGFAALFFGALLAVLRNLGLVPMSPLTQFGAQIGAGLEVPLLLVGLYFRSRERRDNLTRAGALGHIDPLTGLSNHRVLLERLAHSAHRVSEPAVLRVRVGNAAQLREAYGADVLQAALVLAGGCVTHVAREGDTVARHRDGDFVLLLGGRPGREQVAEAAQRIIARGLAQTPDLPERQSLRLLVAAAVPPLALQGEPLLHALGELLAELQARPGKALRYLE